MDIEEIKESGLLELYALGELSTAERAEVESYMSTYPELRIDLFEIEKSLEALATTSAIKSPDGLKQKVMDSIRGNAPRVVVQKSAGFWPAIAALFGLGVLAFGYLFYQKDAEAKQLQQQLTILHDTCDATTNQLTGQLNELRQLTLPGNKILLFAPTPGFAQTDLYLHHNVQAKKNFIQVRNLPAIAENQSYQLWSIKTNQAPAPLDVFELPDNGLVEVQFVEGTEVYAITIEPEGGSEIPTLEYLIGTVGVSGI